MKKDLLRIICRNSDILFFNKLTLNKLTKLNIIRGGGNRKLGIKYNEHIYIFEELELNDNHFILFSQDETNECISIVVSLEDNIAEIHGVSNFKNCLIDTNNNIGFHLIKITLKMLKKYSNKLNINRITLMDNSIKKPAEKSEDDYLARWISTQNYSYRDKIAIMKNEEIYKAYTDFLNNDQYKQYLLNDKEIWLYKFDKLKEYLIKNNKKPTPYDKDENIKSIGNWTSRQIINYKKKEGVLKSNEFYIKWTEFINDPMYKKYF
jgi:hypothetical protein